MKARTTFGLFCVKSWHIETLILYNVLVHMRGVPCSNTVNMFAFRDWKNWKPLSCVWYTYTVGLKCPTNNKQFSWYCPCKGTVPWNKYGFLIRAVALMLNNGPWTDLFYNFLILCNNYLCTFKFNGPVHYFFRRAIFITRGITGPLNLPVHR